MPLNNTERMFWRRQNTICIFLYPDAIWRMYYSMVLKMTHNCFQLVYLPGFKSEKSYYAYRWKCYESHFLTVAVKHMNKYIYIYIWIKVNKQWFYYESVFGLSFMMYNLHCSKPQWEQLQDSQQVQLVLSLRLASSFWEGESGKSFTRTQWPTGAL